MDTATKRKVSELEGAELDYWVAKAEVWPLRLWTNGEEVTLEKWRADSAVFAPSTQWDLGGLIIERERIAIGFSADEDGRDGWMATYDPCAFRDAGGTGVFGPTPLIAAMRCYVASKFGKEVGD